MSINSYIKDPDSNRSVNVLERDNIKRIPVLTEELKKFTLRNIFFTNDIYGFNLNQDASIDYNEEIGIHNGTDNDWWTATVINGTWDFSSTTYAVSGSFSIDATDTVNNDVAQFENITDINLSQYNIFEGWIYITKWKNLGTKQLLAYGWDTNLNKQIGEAQDISNYINTDNTDVWQKFSIDFQVNYTINAIRIKTVDIGEGDAPNYYLDELKLVDTTKGSGPLEFTIQPPNGVWWYIEGFDMVISAPYDSILTGSTLPKIPYDGLFGISLNIGINYKRQHKGIIDYSITFNHLLEILNQNTTSIPAQGADELNTWIKIKFDFKYPPYLLMPEYEDYIKIILNDDLSSLNMFRVLADIKEENR